jgi:ABC-type oligopeptide transport system substrate-binding subunit
VEVALERVDFAQFRESPGTDPPHMTFTNWYHDYLDPDNFLRVAVDHRRRFSGWQDAAYDRLVEQARHVTNQSERMKLYRQADTILMQEAWIIPTFYSRQPFLFKPWVRFAETPYSPNVSVDIIIEPH